MHGFASCQGYTGLPTHLTKFFFKPRSEAGYNEYVVSVKNAKNFDQSSFDEWDAVVNIVRWDKPTEIPMHCAQCVIALPSYHTQ